jgi:hypothetical protein
MTNKHLEFPIEENNSSTYEVQSGHDIETRGAALSMSKNGSASLSGRTGKKKVKKMKKNASNHELLI